MAVKLRISKTGMLAIVILAVVGISGQLIRLLVNLNYDFAIWYVTLPAPYDALSFWLVMVSTLISLGFCIMGIVLGVRREKAAKS